jgi:hypothetical protein
MNILPKQLETQGQQHTNIDLQLNSDTKLRKSTEIVITEVWNRDSQTIITQSGNRRVAESHAGVVNSTGYIGKTSPKIGDPLMGLDPKGIIPICELKIERMIGTTFILLAIGSITNQLISQEHTDLQMGKGGNGLEAAHAALMPGAFVHIEKDKLIDTLKEKAKSIFKDIEKAFEDHTNQGDQNELKETLACFNDLREILPLNLTSEQSRSLLKQIGLIGEGLPENKRSQLFLNLYSRIDDLKPENFINFIDTQNLIKGLFFEYSLNSTDDLPFAFNHILDQMIEHWMRPQIWALINECAIKKRTLDESAGLFLNDLSTCIHQIEKAFHSYIHFFKEFARINQRLEQSLNDLKNAASTNTGNIEQDIIEYRERALEYIYQVASLVQLEKDLKRKINLELDLPKLSEKTKEANTFKCRQDENSNGYKYKALDGTQIPTITEFHKRVQTYMKRACFLLKEFSSLSITLRMAYEPGIKNLPREKKKNLHKTLKLKKVLDKLDPTLSTDGLKGQIRQLFPGEIAQAPVRNKWDTAKKVSLSAIENLSHGKEVLEPRSSIESIKKAIETQKSAAMILSLLADRHILYGQEEIENIKFILQYIFRYFLSTKDSSKITFSTLFDGSLGIDTYFRLLPTEAPVLMNANQPNEWLIPNKVTEDPDNTSVLGRYKNFVEESKQSFKRKESPQKMIDEVFSYCQEQINLRRERFKQIISGVESKYLGLQDQQELELDTILADLKQADYVFTGKKGHILLEAIKRTTTELTNAGQKNLEELSKFLEESGQDLLALSTLLERLKLRNMMIEFINQQSVAECLKYTDHSQAVAIDSLNKSSYFQDCIGKGSFFSQFRNWLLPDLELTATGELTTRKEGKYLTTYKIQILIQFIDYFKDDWFGITPDEFYPAVSKHLMTLQHTIDSEMSHVELIEYIDRLDENGLKHYAAALEKIRSAAGPSEQIKFLLTSEIKNSELYEVRSHRLKRMTTDQIAMLAVTQILCRRVGEIQIEKKTSDLKRIFTEEPTRHEYDIESGKKNLKNVKSQNFSKNTYRTLKGRIRELRCAITGESTQDKPLTIRFMAYPVMKPE